MSNMSTTNLESVDWAHLERGRTTVIQSQPDSSIAATMVKRLIYQPKVSISDGPDLAEAITAGSLIAADRLSTHPIKARARVESAMAIHFGSLMRDILHTKTQCKARAKAGKAGSEVYWHPQRYRKIWSQYINGLATLQKGDWLKVRKPSEGDASHLQAFWIEDEQYAKWMNNEIDWMDLKMEVMPLGGYAGPVLAVATVELAPNMTIWFARIPSPDLSAYRVVALGANLHVSIGQTSPTFDAEERRKLFLKLMEKCDFENLGPIETKIMDGLTPMIEKEAGQIELPDVLRKALAAYRPRATALVANASTIIIEVAAASSSVVEGMIGQASRMWPSMSGNAAAGSGGLSSTDTISNVPSPTPLKASDSEGHSSHNKQPRPPPPPPPQKRNKPVQQMMEEAMSDISSPRDPETEDESDGSSEMIKDDDGVTLVKYKDYHAREGHASQFRKNYEENVERSKIPRAPGDAPAITGRFRPKQTMRMTQMRSPSPTVHSMWNANSSRTQREDAEDENNDFSPYAEGEYAGTEEYQLPPVRTGDYKLEMDKSYKHTRGRGEPEHAVRIP